MIYAFTDENDFEPRAMPGTVAVTPSGELSTTAASMDVEDIEAAVAWQSTQGDVDTGNGRGQSEVMLRSPAGTA